MHRPACNANVGRQRGFSEKIYLFRTILFCDTDGGAITVNMYAGVSGRHHKIINCGTSGNLLTVDPNGTEQIYASGAGTAVTLIDGEVIDIHFDETEGWF